MRIYIKCMCHPTSRSAILQMKELGVTHPVREREKIF